MIQKFRALDTFKKKWVNHFYITQNGLIYNMEQQHRDLIGAIPIEKSGLDVMAFTGIFDHNETPVEIYEGDIVERTALIPGGKDFIGVVKMLEGAWVIDNGSAAISLWTEVDENLVVGNIYDTPDMIQSFNSPS